jgi:hypothetical protein
MRRTAYGDDSKMMPAQARLAFRRTEVHGDGRGITCQTKIVIHIARRQRQLLVPYFFSASTLALSASAWASTFFFSASSWA